MAATPATANLHENATQLYAAGKLTEAAKVLSEAIGLAPSATLWNDWAAVQVGLGQFLDAERAFRYSLSLEPGNAETSANLGALLFGLGRRAAAIPFLEHALEMQNHPSRPALQEMLTQCRETASQHSGEETQPEFTPYASSLTGSGEPVAPANISYDDWFASVFNLRVPAPGVRIATSFNEDTFWGKRFHNALVGVECEFVVDLLRDIKARNIDGDIAEFGIFEGWWINYLWQVSETLGLARRIYGFDSFQGLSDPHPQHDLEFWKKGQYACSFEQVSKNVHAANRPRIKLVEGFFEKSLRGPDALIAQKFCYARIDCDIYQPALDCLRYLGPRLADGAILVFDDWPHLRGFGEQRAFEEWLPTVPHLRFEFLFYGSIGHFYLRVHRRQT